MYAVIAATSMIELRRRPRWHHAVDRRSAFGRGRCAPPRGFVVVIVVEVLADLAGEVLVSTRLAPRVRAVAITAVPRVEPFGRSSASVPRRASPGSNRAACRGVQPTGIASMPLGNPISMPRRCERGTSRRRAPARVICGPLCAPAPSGLGHREQYSPNSSAAVDRAAAACGSSSPPLPPPPPPGPGLSISVPHAQSRRIRALQSTEPWWLRRYPSPRIDANTSSSK